MIRPVKGRLPDRARQLLIESAAAAFKARGGTGNFEFAESRRIVDAACVRVRSLYPTYFK